ncbi:MULTISPECIES: TonB-dependent receptor [unclassified Pseudodesulfovibrio]|uniref:TonB-dependent receptor n=1 Tax=unclassified Pseudodesulfovibrio TaxID=2661612 RepID=UPI0013E30397|nr:MULTISPECIES: TonB-dependent receptor [unclassified Pseudodesulfovibrio]MCJ2163378.1 TonB-dependent receptor [Pseudodesulfovibrio sp. S3-i]
MHSLKFFGFVFTVSLLLSCPAFASDEQTDEPVTLDAVTVTATKREGSIKDFPGNLTVLDDVFIEARGVNTLGDLVRFAPNIYVKDTSSGGSIVCRGISTIDTSLFSPMGLYVNDVAYPMGYMVNQGLLDVERVEVLRGPQATLYGRNSESGVINIVLKEPDNEQRNKTLFELGNYATARLGASTSGPIVDDTLFYNLSLQGYTTDGYVKNIDTKDTDVAGEKTVNGAGTLRWTPTDDWDISLNLDGAKRDLGISALRYEEGPNTTGRNEVHSNEKDKAYETELGQSTRVKYSWSGTELTSISSHRSFDREHHLDSDRTAAALSYSELDVEMDSWSQEFRLASKDNSTLSWLLGLYGRYETIDAGIDFNHINPLLASKRSGDSKDLGYAGFGQATYEIVDGLRITGGLRLDISRNSGKQTYTPNTGPVSYEDDVNGTELLPMASLAYDFSPHVTAYTAYSKGFLAGGFNFYSAIDKDSFTYEAEHSTNYEVGIKTNWIENTLNLNATVFYTDITDKQVREEIAGAGMGVWKFTNAAGAHTQGVELEAQYRPVPEIELTAGLGYAESKVDDWTTTVGGTPVDYSGNKLPWAPEYTYNLGVAYTHPNGFFAMADLLGTGEQYFDAANELKEDGYQTVNLRAGYRINDAEISLWCNNLFDEEYAVKKVNSGAGLAMVEDGTPRTFGFTFNWRF